MSLLTKDFKNELRAKANASLQRHFQTLEASAQTVIYEPPSPETLADFTSHLRSSHRILLLLGAGLSASSGIPTYRSSGGFWRTYSDQQLAQRDAFEEDPVLVWQFYDFRRRQAKAATPNAAHVALAELARRKPGLFCINQNVDGLCQRAGMPEGQITDLHGSLFRVRCFDEGCGYEEENFEVPIVPELEGSEAPAGLGASGEQASGTECKVEDLPRCPKCRVSLLRPATVWFGEGLPYVKVKQVDEWLRDGSSEDKKVDLMLVVGTSAVVWPAAGYIGRARKAGARVAFFNTEVKSAGSTRPEESDWMFLGDAAQLVPQALSKTLES